MTHTEEEKFEVIDEGPSLHEIMTVTPVLFLRDDNMNETKFYLKGIGWKSTFIEGILWDTTQYPHNAEWLGNTGSRALLICGRIVQLAQPFIALYHPQTRKGRLWLKERRASEMLYDVDSAKQIEALGRQLDQYESVLHRLDPAVKIQLLKDRIRYAPTLADFTKQFLFWFIAESRDLTEQISVGFFQRNMRSLGQKITKEIRELNFFTSSGQTPLPFESFINGFLDFDVPEAFRSCPFPKVTFYMVSSAGYPEIDLVFTTDFHGRIRELEMTSRLVKKIKDLAIE